jgi:hypothetical protein
MAEIKKLKSSSESLFDIVILLKNENFNLQKQLAEITIECNRILRSGKCNGNCDSRSNNLKLDEK